MSNGSREYVYGSATIILPSVEKFCFEISLSGYQGCNSNVGISSILTSNSDFTGDEGVYRNYYYSCYLNTVGVCDRYLLCYLEKFSCLFSFYFVKLELGRLISASLIGRTIFGRDNFASRLAELGKLALYVGCGAGIGIRSIY